MTKTTKAQLSLSDKSLGFMRFSVETIFYIPIGFEN
jgi:hypothetical protein